MFAKKQAKKDSIKCKKNAPQKTRIPRPKLIMQHLAQKNTETCQLHQKKTRQMYPDKKAQAGNFPAAYMFFLRPCNWKMTSGLGQAAGNSFLDFFLLLECLRLF